MGLFKKKGNDFPEFLCHCGGEFFKMGNIYECQKCGETAYMDDDGDLVAAEEVDAEYDYDNVYDDEHGTSQWDEDNE